jgi:type VI protein secretion system component Hcp
MVSRPRRCLVALAALLVAALALAPVAGAEEASSLGPLEFFTGGTATIVAPSLESFSYGVSNAGGAGLGAGSGKVKVEDIHLTKSVDASSPKIFAAAAKGTHFALVAIEAQESDSSLSICLGDAFISSDYRQADGSGTPQESVSIAFARFSEHHGEGCTSADAGPGVVSTVTALGPGAAAIVARVDCLQPRCAGRLAIALPGGVTTGGGKFSIGDGSVKVLRLSVPPPARGALRALGDGSVKTIITLKGGGSPIVAREPLSPAPKKIAGLPALTLAPASPAPTPPVAPTPTPEPAPTPTPSPLGQTLQIAGCSTEPIPRLPSVITVAGSLAPARGGVPVSLEFTPAPGSQPLPAPVIESVTTDAAGNFTANFDRQEGGEEDAWSVTASVAEGGGYGAATSAPCVINVR